MLRLMSWYPLEAADASVFSSAPHVYRFEKHYDASPERVWESLSSDECLAAWSPAVSRTTWTTPRPFGVDTTRELALAGGAVKVKERFFRWDEGKGYSFYVTEANIPMLQRLAEDYVIEPEGSGTRFLWTVAIEPRPKFALPVRLLSPVNKLAFGRMAADGAKYFRKHG
jgi:hypothetical protein